jgi:hypothetical protein
VAYSDQAAVVAAKLHSKYQPQIEADRYIAALNLKPEIDCFIVIEPGLGYLISALKKMHPASVIVALHADSCFRAMGSPVPAWYPDSDVAVQEFLENEIPEAASIQLIEWKPSFRIFGDSCLMLARESVDFIKRVAASRRTSTVFGRKWVRNFFRNVLFLNNTMLYRTTDLPIVITGAGPSIEAVLPELRDNNKNVFIIAASSSLLALASGGIVPDMVMNTDGGNWALLHLHACLRCHDAPMLAMTLSSAIPSQCSALPVLPLSDGSIWQSMALNAANIPSICIPQRGTVTASALELAMIVSTGNIFLAGMDFSVRGIQSHARPYGFDHFFLSKASRFQPVYSQLFMRSSDIGNGGSHDVYAAWFKSRLASWPKRIFSLGGNHNILENSLPQGSLAKIGKQKNGGDFKMIATNISPKERCKKAVSALLDALGTAEYAKTLTDELAPLLLPSKAKVSAQGVADALYGIAKKYCEEHNG